MWAYEFQLLAGNVYDTGIVVVLADSIEEAIAHLTHNGYEDVFPTEKEARLCIRGIVSECWYLNLVSALDRGILAVHTHYE